MVERAAGHLEIIREWEKQINQASTMLADWTKKLVTAEAGRAEHRGFFDACVLEIQARRKDN